MPKAKVHPLTWWLKAVGLVIVAVLFFSIGLNATLFQGSLFNESLNFNFQNENQLMFGDEDELRLASDFSDHQEEASDELRLYEYDPETVEQGWGEVNWSVLEMARQKCDQFECNEDHFGTLNELELRFNDLERYLMERNVEMANQEVQYINDLLRAFNQLGNAQNNNNNGTTQTPVNGGTGEIAIEQLPVAGVVDIAGPSPQANFRGAGLSYQGMAGDYTLASITPPVGYELDQVIDWGKSMTTYMSAPYKHTLTPGGLITYLVQYKKKVAGLEVNANYNVQSSSYVKGSKQAKCGNFTLKANKDIVIKRLLLRVYADDDGVFDNGQGDIDAKSFISNARMYNGSNLWGGPEALSLVDGNQNGIYDVGVDYNRVLFDNLNISLKAGNAADLTFALDALNSWSNGSRYIACGMDPLTDIDVVDTNGNFPGISGQKINMTANPSPVLTFIQSGELSATAVAPSANVVTSGAYTNVAKYAFAARNEAFNVTKLTVINDTVDEFDSPQATNLIQSVELACPDVNGIEQKRVGVLTGGSITFSGLSCYVPNNANAIFTLSAKANPILSTQFTQSGKYFRLGILEGSSNNSSTFEAVGAASSVVTYFNKAADIKSAKNIPRQIVRKSKPLFALGTQLSTAMPTAAANLYDFKITGEGGEVSLARLVFEITTSGLTDSTADIYNFSLRGNGQPISGVNLWGWSKGANDPAVNLKGTIQGSGLAKVSSGAGIQNGTYYVIATFDQGLQVAAGNTLNLSLRADAILPGQVGSSLQIKLLPDPNEYFVDAKFSNGNGFRNTSHIIGSDGSLAVLQLNVSSSPLASGSIKIGDCIINFTNAPDNTNCLSGNANINISGKTSNMIAQSLSKLTNITDFNHGTLSANLTQGGLVRFEAGRSNAGNIAFIDSTGGSINAIFFPGKRGSSVDSLFYGLTGATTIDEERFVGHKKETVFGLLSNLNVIWSDHSGGDIPNTGGSATVKVHEYPEIKNNTMVDYGGTVDWMNGYGLDTQYLSPFIYTR